MPRMKILLPLFCLVVGAPLAAQRVLGGHHGPQGLGAAVRPAGDVDGDGVPDFVATISTNVGNASVEIVAGSSGALLRTLTGINQGGSSNPLDAVGIGDVNGDGRSDIVVATYFELRVFSGATGAQLWAQPTLPWPGTSVCPAGDLNGDGVADFAFATYRSGTSSIEVLNGANGAVLATVANLANNQAVGSLVGLGDLNGDRRQDFAFGITDRVYVVTTVPAVATRTILGVVGAARALAVSDVDGDGRGEVLIGDSGAAASTGSTGRVLAFDVVTGALRRTFEMPADHVGNFGGAIASIGDLDLDGVAEVAIGTSNALGEVVACSGRSARPLWSMTGTVQFAAFGGALASIGDVDGDGFADLAVGCRSSLSGVQIVSTKILADVTFQNGACGGGPFYPQLGMTRPVLGQTTDIVLRDGAPNAGVTLAFSLAPALPTYLGASTCTAWFDVTNWVILFAAGPPLASWSLPVPIPNVPQLAGLQVALQCFYAPTAGPLGYDLSNGLHARIGF